MSGVLGNPLTDCTSIVAVESLFRSGRKDPWGPQLAGEIGDLFIYSDRLRFSLHMSERTEDTKGLPLVQQLAKRDSGAIVPETYALSSIKDDLFEDVFAAFSAWARANQVVFRNWSVLHKETWVASFHAQHMDDKYVFPLDRLKTSKELAALAQEMRLPKDILCYAFDTVLKLPLIGSRAGENEVYRHHPIRQAFPPFLQNISEGNKRPVAISFRTELARKAPKLTFDDYAILLHELRGYVREAGWHLLRPGEVSRDEIRKVCAKAALPARLSGSAKVLGVLAAALTALGAVAAAAPIASVAGGVVAVAAYMWKGQLPGQATYIKWLHPLLVWDLEQQSNTTIE